MIWDLNLIPENEINEEKFKIILKEEDFYESTETRRKNR